MKLRLKGDSIRLRMSRSDVATLLTEGRVEEITHFFADDPGLSYVLESAEIPSTEVVRSATGFTVRLPADAVRVWAESEQVGIYETLSLGPRGVLEVIVEKDFACLDLSDADNIDTFPNPNAGAVC